MVNWEREQTIGALVVEDEAPWQDIFREILHDVGFTVEVATTYDQAVAHLRRRAFQLAIVDISLSQDDYENRDGMHLLRHIAGQGDLPTVVVSGYGTVELAVEALTRYHAVDFVRKETFDRRAFVESVRRAVRGAGSGEARSARAVGSSQPSQAPLVTGVENRGRVGPATGLRVLVVEDDSGWQAIYQEILAEEGHELQLAISYGEARGWLEREAFALVIVDLKLVSSLNPEDNRDGYRLLRTTQRKQVPTILISALAGLSEIDRAYDEYGVFAFLDKEGFDRRGFIQTLRDALARQRPGAPGAAMEELPEPLTEREQEVLILLADGRTNKEIADRLVISLNTVKKHVYNIFGKLGVSTRAAAASWAVRSGLVTRDGCIGCGFGTR